MNKLSILSLIIGVVTLITGVIPFMFSYPFTDAVDSGPSNMWQLYIMISYEGQPWYLIIGILLLLIYVIGKSKKRKMK